jgi:flavin-dependent dehydrogenase
VSAAGSDNAVVIVGGGPAGAAAARLLALWGHDVRFITRRKMARAALLAESLPPSCKKLLDVLGVTDEVDRAAGMRSSGNTVWWGSSDIRVEYFPSGQLGWQITADALSEALVQSAANAGVTLDVRSVRVADLDALPPNVVVLDCSGRSGVIARARQWRVYEPALKSIAIVGVWQHERWPLPETSHTLIESYGDGWMWSVPVGGGRRSIAAMVDPRVSNLETADAIAVYQSEIAKTAHFRALTRDAELLAKPCGFDASMYYSSRYADGRTLVVGDAASFIDPLSSAGVKKALASGWLAAVATHTALLRPEMRATAFEFFAAREEEMYRSFREMTRKFLAQGASGHIEPFWSDRAAVPDGGRPSFVVDEAAIGTAYERIRHADHLDLEAADGVHVAPCPAVTGCEIVLEPRVRAPGAVAVRYQDDVDLVALVELVPHARNVGLMFEEYVRRSGPVPLPDFLRVLASLVAAGWLVWRQ